MQPEISRLNILHNYMEIPDKNFMVLSYFEEWLIEKRRYWVVSIFVNSVVLLL